MDSSRGLVASIATLGLVVAAAITLLVISGAPLDFSNWPRSPEPRPAPEGEVDVLGESAKGGQRARTPSLLKLDVSVPRLARGGAVDETVTLRARTRPVSVVTPRRRAAVRRPHQFRRGRRRTDGGAPTPVPAPAPQPPAPVTAPAPLPSPRPPSQTSAPTEAPKPTWVGQWENSKKKRPKPHPQPAPEPQPPPEPPAEPEPEPEPGEGSWPGHGGNQGGEPSSGNAWGRKARGKRPGRARRD